MQCLFKGVVYVCIIIRLKSFNSVSAVQLCCSFSLCTVHGFLNSFYDVIEGEALDTMFKLNVKGETSLPLFINGTITSERGTASECCILSTIYW